MSKYAPVDPQKIQLIKDLLADPEVNELYRIFINLPKAEHQANRKLIEAREKAFRYYSYARDRFLGLPHLDQLPPINPDNRKRNAPPDGIK